MIIKAGDTISVIAGATVNQYRFCKWSTTTMIQAAAATDHIIGISDIPGVDGTTKLVNEYFDLIVKGGLIAELEIGSGGATVGAALTSDSVGKGVITTTEGDCVGAIAMEAGDENDIIRVMVTHAWYAT